jgi:hypothetical protein
MPVKRPLILNYSGESPTAFAEMDDAQLGQLWTLLQDHRPDRVQPGSFVTLTGKIAWLPGGTSITGTDTVFLTELATGDVLAMCGHRLLVGAISSDTLASVVPLDPPPPEPIGQEIGFVTGAAGLPWLARANGGMQSAVGIAVGSSVWLPDGSAKTVASVSSSAITLSSSTALDGPVALYTGSLWSAWTTAGSSLALVAAGTLAISAPPPSGSALIGSQLLTLDCAAGSQVNVADLNPAPASAGRADGYWYREYSFATAAGGNYVHVGAGSSVTTLDRFGAGAGGTAISAVHTGLTGMFPSPERAPGARYDGFWLQVGTATGLNGLASLEITSVGSPALSLLTVGATVVFGDNPPTTVTSVPTGGGSADFGVADPIVTGDSNAALWQWISAPAHAIKLNALVASTTPALAFVAGRQIGLPVGSAIWPFDTATITELTAGQSVAELASPVALDAPETFWRWRSERVYWGGAGSGSQAARGAVMLDGVLPPAIELAGAAHTVTDVADGAYAYAVALSESAAATLNAEPVRTVLLPDLVATAGSATLLIPPAGPASEVTIAGGQAVEVDGQSYTIDSVHDQFAMRLAGPLAASVVGIAALPAPPLALITAIAIRLPRA